VSDVALVVSIAAVGISAFSASVSTRQFLRTQRTRLGELVSEISRADAEYDRLLEENNDRASPGTVDHHDLRQAVLARQALELLRAARPKPSSRELVLLANTFWRMNDHPTADRLYGQALAEAQREGPSYVSTVRTDYGVYLFDVGRYAEGSAQLGEAVTGSPMPGGDRSRQRRFQTLGMRAVQHARHGYQLDEAEALLRGAQAILDQIQGADFRQEMRDDLRSYREQLAEAQRSARRQGGDPRTRDSS
jgi:Tfp pilus assembly protein PilF